MSALNIFAFLMRFPSFLRPNSHDETSQTRLDRSPKDDTVGQISFPRDPAIFRGVHIDSSVRHPAHDIPLPAFSNRVSLSSKLHELPPQEVIDEYRQRCSDDIKHELAHRTGVKQIISRFSPHDRDAAVEFRAQSHTYFDWLFFYNKLAFQVFDKPLFVGEAPTGVSDIILTREQFRDLIPYIKSDSSLFPSMVEFLKFVDSSFEEDRVQRLK